MKTFRLAIVAVITALTIFGACRRASDNGKIDGYWKIQEIYYIADGYSVYPQNLFIAIQLELFQLQKPDPTAALTGVLTYEKGSDEISVDFRNNPSYEQLVNFGLSSPQTVLHIDKADGKHLVLTSPIAKISCRKW